MDSKTAQGCATCKHWHGGANGLGLCKRYPPTSVAGNTRAQYPATRGSDRCGEHASTVPLRVEGARVGHFPMRGGVVLVRLIVLQALLVLGLIVSPPSIDARPRAISVATASRPSFDRIVIDGADYAFLTPSTGVERIERGTELAFGVACGDERRIEYRVDPEVDYIVTAFVDYPDDGDWHTPLERDTYTIELPRTRLLILDWTVYIRLWWDRTLAQVLDSFDITDSELASSMMRMMARLDSEAGQE